MVDHERLRDVLLSILSIRSDIPNFYPTGNLIEACVIQAAKFRPADYMSTVLCMEKGRNYEDEISPCRTIQGGPSGWTLPFDDITTKVRSQYYI